MLVRDHQAHTAESAGAQRAPEPTPEHLVFAVAMSQPRISRSPLAVIPVATHNGHRGDLGGLVADVQIGRVEIHLGELDVVQLAGPERPHDLIEACADP